MEKRPLFQLVTMLLYLGPLVAGLAGFGWGLVAAFAGIFVLWQIILRPADWPRLGPDWARPGVLQGALARVALVAILVAVCFGIGRGLGGAVGFVPGVPLVVPLALSFLAVPLARLLRDPAGGALRDDRVAEEGTVLVAAPAEPAALTEAIRPLLDLPDTTPDAVAQAAVARLGDSPLSAALLRSLREALTQHRSAAPAARRGLVLWSTEPSVADRFEGAPVLSEAWAAARGWPDLERRFAERGLRLLAADPGLRGDFPPATDLLAAAAAMQDREGARALAALAEALAQGDGTARARA